MRDRFCCPKCRMRLSVREAPDMTIGECATCLGIWLDNRACQDLIRGMLSEVARETIKAIDAAPPEPRPTGTGPAYRERGELSGASMECPICGVALRALSTLDDVHGIRIRIDICSSHGTWFDRHEAWALFQAAEMKTLSLVVASQAAAAEQAFKEHERVWAGFTSSAVDWDS